MAAARRYVAARNTELENPRDRDDHVWGVWDQETEIWVEDVVSEHWNDAQVAANRWEFDEGPWRVVQEHLLHLYEADYVTPYLACIKSQGDWRYVTARANSFAEAQFEPGPEAYDDGLDFVVSGLLECHDGPHLETCPNHRV